MLELDKIKLYSMRYECGVIADQISEENKDFYYPIIISGNIIIC